MISEKKNVISGNPNNYPINAIIQVASSQMLRRLTVYAFEMK